MLEKYSKNGDLDCCLITIEDFKKKYPSIMKNLINRKSVKLKVKRAYDIFIKDREEDFSDSAKASDKYKEMIEGATQMYEDFLKENPENEQVKHPLKKLLNSSLERTLSKYLAFIFILGSLFFLSSNVTANAIGNLTTRTSNFIGIPLFFVGLGLLAFSLKK